MTRVSVVGLGKLGLPLAVSMASRGYTVVGFDADPSKLVQYQQGIYPNEPQVAALIQKHHAQLKITDDLSHIRRTSITFLVVPTPSQADGAFSNSYLSSALQALGHILKNKRSYHLVVIVSTVMPGSMLGFKGVLEEITGKCCGRDFGLCYSPAFIALGNVVQNFLHPDFVLVGESDRKAGRTLETFYKQFNPGAPPIHRMNFVNAEVAKIALNSFITMKISYANTLARLAETLPGADSSTISEAIGCDRRIGKAYLKGAVAYGGPCFPRDNRAFDLVLKAAGLTQTYPKVTDGINQRQNQQLAQLVLNHSSALETIGILGLSYKPDTDVIEESCGMTLAQALAEKRRVVVYDPVAMLQAKPLLQPAVVIAPNLASILKQSDVLVLATPCKEFQKITQKQLTSQKGSKKVFIDCWRMFMGKPLARMEGYLPLGVGRQNQFKSTKKEVI